MNKINKTIFLIATLFVFQAEALVVTSLNIRWFGKGGSLKGSLEDEYRTEDLKDYINNVLPKSDVYVFQEIVDKVGLFEIMKAFECVSYDASRKNHLFVVMCSKKGLLKNHEVNQEVRLNRWGLRAALIGDYELNGKEVRVVGVHLKAGLSDSLTRIEQIKALQKNVSSKKSVVVIGDFNTFKVAQTMGLKDDSVLISEELGQDFSLVANEVPTYMGFGGRVLDRAWIKNLKKLKVDVLGPCKEGSVTPPYDQRSFYYRFISDHCALRLEVD